MMPDACDPATSEQTLTMRVTGLHRLTPAILAISFEPEAGTTLAPVSAGAHIDVHLPTPGGTLIRQYSLTSTPGSHAGYDIAVLREADGRGGSAWLHDRLKVGDTLTVGHPRNHFMLFEPAAHSILIAGGIGIAPIWSLAQRLLQLDASWELHYAARNAAEAAFLDMLRERAPGHVSTYLSDAGQRLSLEAIAVGRPAEAHVYCCGPARMMTGFDAAFAATPEPLRHREHFVPVAEMARTGGFDVVLARSQRTMRVEPGQTILQALRAAGFSASFSCEEGVCGMCETRIVDGVADHRDSVLTPEEQARGESMMICCSGAKSSRLVLDL